MRKQSIKAAKEIILQQLKNDTRIDNIYIMAVNFIAEHNKNDSEKNEETLLEIVEAYNQYNAFLQKIIMSE